MNIAGIELSDVAEGNLKRLSDNEVVPYLNRLKSRLENLSVVLKKEGDEFVIPYVDIITNSLGCMLAKYELDGQDKLDFSLTINPTNSGFPTPKDFYMLEKNKEEAKGNLETLPPRDEIINKIGSAVLRGDSCVNAQMLLRRFNFFSKVSRAKVLEGYYLNQPKFVKEDGKRRSYVLEWSCIERVTNLPVFYRLCLTHNKSSPPLEREFGNNLKTVIYQTQFPNDIKSFVSFIDNEVEEVHPKLLEKYTIGPYYDSLTRNNPQIVQLFDGLEDPSLLKFTFEKILSEGVRQYGNWLDMITGKKTEREVFGPVDSETRIVAPFRIKQKLNGCDENGKPCKVYGITNGGEI